MPGVLEEVSTITAKGQTTIPKSVRQAIDVAYGDKIAFSVDQHGVSVHWADAAPDDPAIDGLLFLLAAGCSTRATLPALWETLLAAVRENSPREGLAAAQPETP